MFQRSAKSMKTFYATLVICLCFAASATAGLMPAIATSSTPTTAEGTMNGVAWSATSSSPFLGVNVASGTWDLGISLPAGGLFLGVSNVNAGDSQVINFSSPVADTVFFIENFDSNSMANISTDATSLQIVSASSSISFDSSSASSGVLSTSNAGFDGEGDAILLLSGPVSYVQFDYTAGEGANGIYYGFAQGAGSMASVAAVPEPSALLYLLICAGGATYAQRRRKMKSGLAADSDQQA